MPSEPGMGGAPLPGTTIDGKYVVGEVIARGGMGCLVEAEQTLLKRSVAIKFVLADRRRTAHGRLLREARAMQSLTSEHVAKVFDLGLFDGAPYIVMERLEGQDLSDEVAFEGPLEVDEAVDCILEAAAALAEAHALGIVHRDIKPSNLFLAETRSRKLVKVLDFGISKVTERTEDENLEETTEDSVLGTPFYMSPEQIRNPATIDGRADVWALAVTLFFLLTGEHPFEGKTARAVTAAIFTDPPLRLTKLREVDPALEEALEQALQKRPDKRTRSVVELARALLPFASARGRAAAALVEATAPDLPSRDRRMSQTLATAATTTAATSTQDGLASTQETPDEGGSTSLHSADLPVEDRRRPLVALGLAALLGGLLVWGLGGRPAPSTPAVESAVPPAPTSAEPAESPPPRTSASARASASGTATATASVGPSGLPRPAIAPPAPTSPAATIPAPKPPPEPAQPEPAPPEPAPPEPAVDIDGVPIID